jgi:hypothetical protein
MPASHEFGQRLFTLTYTDPIDAENVGQVLIDAGTRGGKVIDRGFYEDGRSLMEQVDKWRASRREASEVE